MAPMSSADAFAQSLAPHAAGLIGLARASIHHGLAQRRALPVWPGEYAPPLRDQGASFVTLHLGGELRGCVGSIEPRVSLVEDVARNAYLSAFEDSRFDPLQQSEFAGLEIEISVLGPRRPLDFRSEAELLERLAPMRDGLILEHDGRRGVFLPQVWEDLPEPADFLAHLKAKAGMGRGPLGHGAEARVFSVVKLTLSAKAA